MDERLVDHFRPPVVGLCAHRGGHGFVHARRRALELRPVSPTQGVGVPMAELVDECLHQTIIVDREGSRIGPVVAKDAVALLTSALRPYAVAEVGLRVGEERNHDKVPVGRDTEEPSDPLEGSGPLHGSPEPGVRRVEERPMGLEEGIGSALQGEPPRGFDEPLHLGGGGRPPGE